MGWRSIYEGTQGQGWQGVLMLLVFETEVAGARHDNL